MPTFQQSRQVISETPLPDFIPCAFETVVCISFSLETSSHCRKLFAKIFFWEQGEEVWGTAFDFSSEDQFRAVCFLYAVMIFLFCSSLWNPFKSILVFESYCPKNCHVGWSLSQPFLSFVPTMYLKLSVKASNSCWFFRVCIASIMALRNCMNRICN